MWLKSQVKQTSINVDISFFLFIWKKIVEEGHVFQDEVIYPEITLKCGQTNENELKWHWINHKNESGTELPECVVSSHQPELILLVN